MSSIAYVTDRIMIEFHRLNGNSRLNFWRPSSSIRFADFQQGDLLFFLAKGTERNKEKGIVGYGTYDYGLKLSPNQAWNRFGTLNGYHSKQDFFNAITKVSKNNVLPRNIGCLCLKDVVYFQEPLYLSDLDIRLSNRLQSYTYLDTENGTYTLKILERAKEIGVDMWSQSISEQSSDISVIEHDQIKNVVSKACSLLGTDFYNETQMRRLKSLAKLSLDHNDEFEYIKGNRIDCYSFRNNVLTIRVPLIVFAKNIMMYVQFVIGRLQSYRSFLKNYLPSEIKIELEVLTSNPLEANILMLFEGNGITVTSISQVQ